MSDPGDAAAAKGSPHAHAQLQMAAYFSLLQAVEVFLLQASSLESIAWMTPLAPWILQDVRNAQTCKTDKFLAQLLQHVSKDPGPPAEALLNKCLDAVLPFCNGDVGSDTAGLSPLIRTALTEYAKCTSEVRCMLLLSRLATMRSASQNSEYRRHTCPASERIDMFFQRNDPKWITQKHSGENKAQRKPDLVILPFTEDPSTSKSYWKDLLSVAEFKFDENIKMSLLPQHTLGKIMQRHSEFSYQSDGRDPDKDPETKSPEVPHSSQVNATEQAQVTGLSTPATSGANAKRPSESDADERSSKRIKTGENPENKPLAKQIGGAVQTALYGAEMFTATLAVNHIINFTVRSSSPPAHILPGTTTAPLNHPGSIEAATVAPSSTGSPIPVSAHASAQPSDSCSTADAQAASGMPSLSTAAVTSTPAPLSVWKDLPRTPPQCPPQEDDLPLLNVLSPEEIRIIQEHRRRNGTSPDFSASPADDHQSPVYSGLSTSPPAQFQCFLTPSASQGPFPSSRQLSSPGIARPSTSSVGSDPSPDVISPLHSMSPSPGPSCLASSPPQMYTTIRPHKARGRYTQARS
ncbi:hypothetical protein BU15DRAFT_77719 [Melanogaster broomeanus]|nr:hypothetical protein BU15DRAFT_77719 [Melanogaster broomeanus]